MKIVRSFHSAGPLLRFEVIFLVLLFATVSGFVASAQTIAEASPPVTGFDLPDAPGFSSDATAPGASSGSREDMDDGAAAAGFEDPATTNAPRRHRRFATRSDMTIQPGQVSPYLDTQKKVKLGLAQSFTLFSAIGWVASAGYTQLGNGSPNYGTDSGAFGMRLGATSIRAISQNILGNAVLAPILHEDPRYYRMGKSHGYFARTVYAATRTLVTKSDDGRTRPNLSLVGGHLAGSALTNAYYPQLNQGFTETAKTFGNSMGGAAVGFLVTEFLDDALHIVRLQSLE